MGEKDFKVSVGMSMEDKVRDMTEKLKTGWKSLENEFLEKRLRWFEDNKDGILRKLQGTDVNKAYQLLLMKMGIDNSEARIVEESGNRITFHSTNFCPVIDACDNLGLDTREICKYVFEKPAEELIKMINPRLKFSRNYSRIRPYAPYCEEMIILE